MPSTNPVTQAAAADVVFEGTVQRIWYELRDPEHDFVVTLYEVAVSETYKGSIESGRIILGVPGGEHADGSTSSIVGAPRLNTGDRVIAHVRVVDDAHVRLQNWTIGLLTLTDGPEQLVLDARQSGRRKHTPPANSHVVVPPPVPGP